LANNRNGHSSRFLPPDPRVVEPYRLTPKLALRLAILGALALAVFAVLFLRLWALQVLSGEQYLRAAQNNQLRMIRVEAPRGVIRDREGRILVDNTAGTAVQLRSADLPEQGRYQLLKRLGKVIKVPAPRMARELAKRKNDPLNPVVVKEGLSLAEIAYLKERRRDFPGVQLVQSFVRSYPHGRLAAHVLGHVGEINQDQLDSRAFAELQAGDKVGQAGVEAAFDHYLRGTPGLNRLRVDSLGQPLGDVTPLRNYEAGNDVRLTIDLELQLAAERALEHGIQIARNAQCYGCWNANGGAVVAMDARNGEVLALASNPTFDPRVFVGKPNPWRLGPLLRPAAAKRNNYPGLNRAISGVYPPGSTFKPVTAIAALEEHLVSPYEPIQCSPAYTYIGENGVPYPFKNWNPFVNTAITLPIAIAWSCDTYFYELGVRFYELRTSPLQQWAKRFGFGKSTGIEIGPEAHGLVPTPAWRLKRYANDPIEKLWKPGDSIQLTIGQKDMDASPLQLARFYAMVANGGRLVTPHLFKDVEGPGELSLVPHPTQPAPQRIDVSSGALQIVREGLFRATHDPDGTSTAMFSSFPVPIAGKTGTAEKYSSEYKRMFDQAWWCGYGPADAAEIVVCALIENGGHGGTSAAPAAREVLAKYFHVDVGEVTVVSTSETD
jgi:penicillin-binding protein 2